jgi:hypothetical protein
MATFRPVRRRRPLVPSGFAGSGASLSGLPPVLVVRAANRRHPRAPQGLVLHADGFAFARVPLSAPAPVPAGRPVVAAWQPRPRGAVRAGLSVTILAGLSQTPSPVDLLEAVLAHLQADGTLAATFGGRFVSDEEALGSAFPYVVVDEVQGPWSYQSRDNSGAIPVDDHRQVRVTIVSVGKAAVRVAGRLVHSSLWDANLTFGTGTLMWFRNETAPTDQLDPERGPGNVDIWRRTYVYEATIARSFTSQS